MTLAPASHAWIEDKCDGVGATLVQSVLMFWNWVRNTYEINDVQVTSDNYDVTNQTSKLRNKKRQLAAHTHLLPRTP
jgi:hypothetical protein